uniref:C-type lectin domain-containing protein n=1 Tax=Acrobeloides nanus TaxID=290746 RepID=A0A914E5Z4_9BILA
MENIYLSQGSNTSDDQHLEWISFAVAAGTSFFFTGSAGSEAEYHILNNNSNLYMYEFTYASNINGDKYKSAEYNPVVHGSELHYVFMEDTTWLPAQNKRYPNNDNAQDCVTFETSSGKWYNSDCDTSQCYICQQFI